MTRQTKIAIIFGVIAVTLFGGVFAYENLTAPAPADASERRDVSVRAESHRLDTAEDGKVTLVEFLDFECEACRAAYPFVEQLRQRYEGRVTFVLRYFPIPSHTNANNAAYAVESAARQGKLEAMYKKMYDTQAEWGESQDSKAALFRQFAQDLGLDMARYDADVASPDVAARIERDVADGRRLGVSGTPTFYLNGQRLAPSTTEEFIEAIDGALAE
ncbi:disulfide bond formation protein DsbA [Aeromicrobium sp. Root495]|uniref:DsbA family protein n=1 Tax=Aeromicrobium sp. Root495 TaxID=1736550 RepID=UPI000701B9E5|nr:thioredoxin domain-containing protein [Aeromicrobium sp. Root495]KQY55365.1 disulfide bond formation protein DsbA [Aeromicrobium sp. Root495]